MKINVTLYWQPDQISKDGGYYTAINSDDWDKKWPGQHIKVGQADVDFELSAFDPRQALVDSLKAEKQKIISEASKQAEQLEEKIQQLLALPAA